MNRRMPFQKSRLFRRFEQAARETLKDNEASRVLKAANSAVSGVRRAGQAWREAKRAVFNAMVKSLGRLGQVLKALIRPGGRRLVNEDRELLAASSLLEAMGGSAEVPQSQQGQIAAELQEAMGKAGVPTGRPGGVEVAPPQFPGTRPTAPQPRSPVPATAPGGGQIEFEEWTGPQRVIPRGWVEVRVGSSIRRYRQNDPMLTGEMIPVTSSNVYAIGFHFNWTDPTRSVLKVQFLDHRNKGPGPYYHYMNVHPDLFLKFRLAASKGKFVWDKLRIRGTVSGHQYEYELKGIVGNYVPRKATRIGDEEWFMPRTFMDRNVLHKDQRQYRSKLGPQYVRRFPSRGRPNRGTPNRGR